MPQTVDKARWMFQERVASQVAAAGFSGGLA